MGTAITLVTLTAVLTSSAHRIVGQRADLQDAAKYDLDIRDPHWRCELHELREHEGRTRWKRRAQPARPASELAIVRDAARMACRRTRI